MAVKTKLHLQSLLLILISFTFVTLLINHEHNIGVFWHLYIIPVVIAALTYDLWGGLIIGLFSSISIIFWLYYFELLFTSEHIFPPAHQEKLLEISIGMSLFALMGIALGHLSSKHKAQENMLEGLSVHDRLTGLFNYGYFLDNLAKEQKRSLRYQNPLSVIMLDVDFFKRFNDTFGHEKGNEVLKRVTKVITNRIRNVDTAARYGGEEFIIILPNATKEQALVVAERIRTAIEKEDFKGNTTRPISHVTISGGIASYPSQAEDIEQLVYKADQALYLAKETGRNQICVYEEPTKLKSSTA